MTKSTFTKTKAQIKSSRYYLFWGAATSCLVVGQVYVGTGYRAMAESMNRWFEETIDIITIPHTEVFRRLNQVDGTYGRYVGDAYYPMILSEIDAAYGFR